MTVSVIEKTGEIIPAYYWRYVMFYHPWKTDYLTLPGLAFEDCIMNLN